MGSLNELNYSTSSEHLKDKEAELGALAIQQFILQDGIMIMPWGLDICFHQEAYLDVRDSQFSDLVFKSLDQSYCIIFYTEPKLLHRKSLLLTSIKLL